MIQHTLKGVIGNLIVKHDRTNSIGADARIFLIDELSDFVERAVVKFTRGQLEHGGSIFDRNTILDADEEVLDMFFYIRTELKKQRILKQQNANHPTKDSDNSNLT
jgi:hypothetical protein